MEMVVRIEACGTLPCCQHKNRSMQRQVLELGLKHLRHNVNTACITPRATEQQSHKGRVHCGTNIGAVWCCPVNLHYKQGAGQRALAVIHTLAKFPEGHKATALAWGKEIRRSKRCARQLLHTAMADSAWLAKSQFWKKTGCLESAVQGTHMFKALEKSLHDQ
eukprot:1158547-Pelagomonas_calceolata.AAC.3